MLFHQLHGFWESPGLSPGSHGPEGHQKPPRSHVSVQMRRLFICPPNYKKKRFRRQRRKPPYFFPKLLNIFFTLPWIVSSFRCSITAASAALLNTLLSGHSLIACRNDW